MTYLATKACHIVAVVAWFAGLFYIFRLYVYHIENCSNEEIRKVFLTMERRLLNWIMAPAALLTILFGTTMLVLNPDLFKAPWLHAKLLLIALLLLYHGYALYIHKALAQNRTILTSKQCRIINEIPTLLLIGIILLAILKPSL